MALNAAQVRALNREANHDPALQPDDGTAPAALGTLLADLGDGAGSLAVATADADATYGQPEADLINEIKADLNALLALFASFARE